MTDAYKQLKLRALVLNVFRSKFHMVIPFFLVEEKKTLRSNLYSGMKTQLKNL